MLLVVVLIILLLLLQLVLGLGLAMVDFEKLEAKTAKGDVLRNERAKGNFVDDVNNKNAMDLKRRIIAFDK